MDDIITNEVNFSMKRLIGAAFFGLILGGCIDIAFRLTILNILATVQRIDVEIARMNYESSIIFGLVVPNIIHFFASASAAFIASRLLKKSNC